MGLMDIIDNVTGKDDEKIRTNERALVLLSEVSDDRYKMLYEFVEKAGIAITLGLKVQYRKISVLSGENADAQDLVNTLKVLAADSNVQEIDVFTYMHGGEHMMYFHDGKKDSRELSAQIAKLGIGKKLRAYYTTACFGSTHAEDMIKAGFNCAAGAVAVNANSAVETPEFITLWGTGSTFRDCIEKSHNPELSKPFEDKARKMGFGEVNSTKRIYGNGSITITTNA